MKQALRTSISAQVVEVAVGGHGDLMAIVEIKFKQLQMEKPNKKIHVYVNISKEIKKDTEE